MIPALSTVGSKATFRCFKQDGGRFDRNTCRCCAIEFDIEENVSATRTLRFRVLIRPKEGILDPQGQAVERALPALGFEGVSHVHVGRLIELDVDGSQDATAEVEQMCERLLANPLIESYEVLPAPGADG